MKRELDGGEMKEKNISSEKNRHEFLLLLSAYNLSVDLIIINKAEYVCIVRCVRILFSIFWFQCTHTNNRTSHSPRQMEPDHR